MWIPRSLQMWIGQDFRSQFVVPLDVHAELVPLLARRGLLMRLAIDVRVQPHRDGGDAVHRLGHGGDRVQFPFTLDVEHQDVRLEGLTDLGIGLADPGEDHARGVGSSSLHTVQLSARDHIERAAGFVEDLQQRQVGVGLHRVTDHWLKLSKAVLIAWNSCSSLALE